ncbi:hypothetical protein ACJMK2_012277, partial [Sinanodonta woodiana]
SNRIGDHFPGDDEKEQFESDERSDIGLSTSNCLHSEITGNRSAEHITPFQGEQSHQPLNNQNITEETEDIRQHKRHHRKKKRTRSKHSHEQTDANITFDTSAMGKGEEKHRKRRKHRKSHHEETEVGVSGDQSLLENSENENIKEKKRRKSKKKRKHKHHTTTEESDGMNVS